MRAEPPIYTRTPAEGRNSLLEVQASSHGRPDAAIADLVVTAQTGPLHLRIIRSRYASSSCPVVLYFHGSGWVLGDMNTHDSLVRELAVRGDAAIVFVDYDRAPEHPYPMAIEQAYAALLYVRQNAREMGLDRDRIAVAGESSGGNIATVLALMTKERSGPALAGQLLLYPTTDCDTASFATFANRPWRRERQWSGSGTSIFLITAKDVIRMPRRSWPLWISYPVCHAHSSSPPSTTSCVTRGKRTDED